MTSVLPDKLPLPEIGRALHMSMVNRGAKSPPHLDSRIHVGGFAIFVIVVFWTAIAMQLHRERDLEIQNAINANENLARTLEEHVIRTVRSADDGLLVLAKEFLRKGASIDIPALQRQGILANPLFIRVSIVGVDGYVLASSSPLADRYSGPGELSPLYLKSGSRDLQIGKPVFDRAMDKQLIFFTRSIHREDGSQVGTASIEIDPAYFTGFFSAIRMGGNGFVGLVGRDGIVRARYWEQAQAAEVGDDLGESELFARLAVHEHGSYLDDGDQVDSRDISARDGVSRILSYRALKDYPLLIRVGVAESDALATFNSRRLWYFIGAGLVSLVTATFAWLLIGSMTRRTRIGAALLANEIRLRDAQAMAQIGSWELDLRSNHLAWSDELFRILEVNPRHSAPSLDTFIELIHPMDRAPVRSAYTESVTRKIGYDLEYRLLMPDRSVKFVHERCSSEYDDCGRPLRSRGTVQNITERREIAAESARLAAIVESSQDAILSCSLDAKILTWNTGAEHLFGYLAAEAKGRDASIIVPVEERDAYYARWLPAVQQGRFPPPYETVRITKDGRRIDVSASISPIHDDAQQINAVSIVIRDLSQKRALQSALRATEIELRLVAANVPGMVFELQRCEGERGVHFTYASEGSKKLFDLNPDQLCGRPELLTGRIAAPDREAFLSSLDASAQNLSPWTWQGRAVSQHDTLRWVQLEATPHRGESGAIIWDGIAIDISNVKNSELKLRQTQQQLRALTAHHEAIREEERARIARELHDELGQLLTGVKLHLSTHRAGGVDRRANQTYVEQLVEQAIQVTRHAVADLRPPVLDQGFAAAVRWYAEQFFRRTGIVCETTLEDDTSILDRHHRVPLFRVLQESLTNVAKHAGATRVEIHFTATRRHCRLQIRDNGNGFRQDHVASKRTFGLLGMRERVSILGGRLNVDSAPGKGTAVIVDLLQDRSVA